MFLFKLATCKCCSVNIYTSELDAYTTVDVVSYTHDKSYLLGNNI